MILSKIENLLASIKALIPAISNPLPISGTVTATIPAYPTVLGADLYGWDTGSGAWDKVYSVSHRLQVDAAVNVISGFATSSNQTTGNQLAQLCGPGPGYTPIGITGSALDINIKSGFPAYPSTIGGQSYLWDGGTAAWVKAKGDGSGNLSVTVTNPTANPETGLAKDLTLKKLVEWTEYPTTWATKDGAFETEITGIPAGKYKILATSWFAASDGVATTITVYCSSDTGFTPGANQHGFYTSDADLALPSQKFEDCFGVPVTVGVAGKIYVRGVTDAATSSGGLSVYLQAS